MPLPTSLGDNLREGYIKNVCLEVVCDRGGSTPWEWEYEVQWDFPTLFDYRYTLIGRLNLELDETYNHRKRNGLMQCFFNRLDPNVGVCKKLW